MDLYMALIEAERERDEWRDIATRLVAGAERQIDDLLWGHDAKPQNPAWIEAWKLYDEAMTRHDAKVEPEPPVETQLTPVAARVAESVKFVVDMMNNGNVNPRDVYPKGRYHGD